MSMTIEMIVQKFNDRRVIPSRTRTHKKWRKTNMTGCEGECRYKRTSNLFLAMYATKSIYFENKKWIGSIHVTSSEFYQNMVLIYQSPECHTKEQCKKLVMKECKRIFSEVTDWSEDC